MYLRLYAFMLFLISMPNFSMALDAESGFRATLDAEEIAWLNAHPIIRFSSDPEFTPVEFIDGQGQYAGMGADYLGLIAKRLGVRFERVAANSLYESLNRVHQGQADLLPVVVKTPQRTEFLNFTAPYLHLPSVVISARRDVENWSLETLRTMKVAVVRGFYTEDWLSHAYPDIDLVQTPDIETALLTTSFGVADAMVGDIATTSHFIGKMKITNLRLALQLEQNAGNSMAVRSDWPILRNVLDKALVSITEDERRAIAKKWIHLENPAWWNNPTFRLMALCVFGALIAFILATLAWNRALTRKVRLRTLALEEAHLRLMQSAKLESIGRLAAGVAHEVKNPLAIIQMGVDFLSADIREDTDAAMVVRDMEDAIHRADAIVKGLLDFSRDKKLDMRKTGLNEVVKDSLKLVNYELSSHNITVEEALSPSLPSINADPDKLKQVFINLFINAIQAMGHDGTLRVTSMATRLKKTSITEANGSVKLSPGDRVVIFTVDDNGPGIDPAKVGKVFDPFFTTKPLGQGTGLGLSVSRTIVELHDGIINLRNREGGGASAVLTFKIT